MGPRTRLPDNLSNGEATRRSPPIGAAPPEGDPSPAVLQLAEHLQAALQPSMPADLVARVEQLAVRLEDVLERLEPSLAQLEAKPASTQCGGMTMAEVAKLIGWSDRSLKRASAAGEVPGRLKIGRSVRHNRAAIERWVAAGCPLKVPSAGRRARA